MLIVTSFPMKLKIAPLLFLLITAFTVYSQPKNPSADSLFHLISIANKDDSNKVKLLLEYSKCFFPVTLDSSMKIYEKSLAISGKLNYGFGITKSLNGIAACYLYQDEYTKAILFYRKALARAVKDKNADLEAIVSMNLGACYADLGFTDSCEKYSKMAVNVSKYLPDKTRYANALDNLGLVYYNSGNYLKSIEYLIEAKNIYEASHKTYELASTYNRIGLIYQAIGNYTETILSYRMALKINKSVNNTTLETAILQNIGLFYVDSRRQFDSARIFLSMALHKAEQYKNEDSRLACLINLGGLECEEKNFKKALSYYEVASKSPLIAFSERQNANLMVNLGYIYLNLGYLSKAREFTEKGIKLAQEHKFATYERDGYRTMADIEAKMNNYKAAFEYFDRYDDLQETLGNENVKQKVAEAIFQNTLKQKENENILLEKNNEIKRQTIRIQWFYIGVTGLIILMGLIMLLITIRYYRRQRSMNQILDQKNQELNELNLTKDKFFSIIAHDLRGSFNVFLGLTELMTEETESLTHDEIRKYSLLLRNSAVNVFSLLENLLEWAKMQQGLITLNREEAQLNVFVDESIEIILEPAKIKNIEVILDIPEDITVNADKNMLQTVFRNIVSNAVKYTPRGGKITVLAKVADSGNVEISIKDTGIGMSRKIVDDLFRLDVQTNRRGTENEPSSGLGLLLCKDFIEKHGGRIWVESEEGKGSAFYFTIGR